MLNILQIRRGRAGVVFGMVSEKTEVITMRAWESERHRLNYCTFAVIGNDHAGKNA